MMDFKMLDSKNISSQEVLRSIEELCTAEEAAACTAACPLHVDGRELCRLIASGDCEAAFKLYRKQAPFAGILAYTCEAPCKDFCIRKDFGGAISIEKLERVLMSEFKKEERAPVFLQKKKERAAIIGGGIRGITAAYELARKGYEVRIYEKSTSLGGKILRQIPERLPLEVFEKELGILNKLGVKTEYQKEIKNIPELLDCYDGVYVSFLSAESYEDYPMILPAISSRGEWTGSGVVYELQQGKSAAFTLDRLFQKVNTEIGREKEGPYRTKLFTNLNGVSEKKSSDMKEGQESDVQWARREAARCIQCKCDICVDKCAFLQSYGKNPRKYIREVYNNLSIAMGTHHANKMINTCALCAQCGVLCPNGLDMGQVFLAAREKMQESKKMPPSAFEFGIMDMEYSMSESFFLAKSQSGYESSAFLFFPGCQLAASEPRLVKEIYKDLCENLEGGVGLLLSCCGILAYWAGDKIIFEDVEKKLKDTWEEMGKPLIITACPNCKKMFGEEMGIPVKSLFHILGKESGPKSSPEKRKMILHHACGARFDRESKEEIRQLAKLASIELIEEKISDRESPCCGWGGAVFQNDKEMAEQITDTAIEQITSGEDLPILTYCVNCRDRFLKKERESFHLLELIYSKDIKANHKFPFWSERRDNRILLKYEMLKEFWGIEMEKKDRLKLYIEKDLENKLEDLHILHSDIEEVISHAQRTQSRLVNPDTGRFTAYYKLKNVTFWVEYSQEGEGYRVYNAYSHRMDFIMDDMIIRGGNNG